ncbi:hypothetical protein O9929_12180 [Vibrio lentus]|nr:hypothetical protein [Vibrio lentus]
MWKIEKINVPKRFITRLKLVIDYLIAHVTMVTKEVGQGIKRAIEDAQVKRDEELWITSKLWNTYHREHVRQLWAHTSRSWSGLLRFLSWPHFNHFSPMFHLKLVTHKSGSLMESSSG